MCIPSVVTWNMPTLLTWAEGTGTVLSLSTAQKCGIKLYHLCGLNARASIVALGEGRHADEQIINSGCDSDVFVGSSLVDICAIHGRQEDSGCLTRFWLEMW